MFKKLFFLSIMGILMVSASCGKDDKPAEQPQATTPAPAPAPAPPPPPANGNPNGNPNDPGVPAGQGQCQCDKWGCYTCDANDWCCEVDSCNGNTQRSYGNWFPKNAR